MISFSNAKINIGLNIVSKRKDGFHNIETVFYPIDFSDIIEIKKSNRFAIINTGLIVDGDIENNLCAKAYKLIKNKYDVNPIKIHLHKIVPFGAGLGGGSSNASFILKSLNNLFNLNISEGELINMSSELGSDCAFFISNKPSFASGKGDIIEKIDIDLTKYYITIIHPNIHVNTASAYKGVIPHAPIRSLKQIINKPIEDWKELVCNDFEDNVFRQYPDIKTIKEKLYKNGAIYASMSGSGSSVYGVFENFTDLNNEFKGLTHWCGKFL